MIYATLFENELCFSKHGSPAYREQLWTYLFGVFWKSVVNPRKVSIQFGAFNKQNRKTVMLLTECKISSASKLTRNRRHLQKALPGLTN